MTELQLYKFIHENDIEFKQCENEGVSDILMFVKISEIEDFNRLCRGVTGVNCVMKNGYFCFWMNEICDSFGIEIENVFKK